MTAPCRTGAEDIPLSSRQNGPTAPPPAAFPSGSGLLEVGSGNGTSFVASLRSSNPLRLLAPVSRGPCVWAFTSSFGGGLVAGDETRIDVRVDPAARCLLGSQAVGKVYRNPEARPCGHRTHAEIGADAVLAFLPDPIQAFAGARYHQRQEFRLAPGAGLVLLDGFTSGRVARGERWEFRRLETRNEVFVDGTLRFLDALVLDPDYGPLPATFRLGRFNYVGLLALFGPPLSRVSSELASFLGARSVGRRESLVVSGGPVGDGVVVRIAAERPEDALHWIRDRLRALTDLLGDDPWQRRW